MEGGAVGAGMVAEVRMAVRRTMGRRVSLGHVGHLAGVRGVRRCLRGGRRGRDVRSVAGVGRPALALLLDILLVGILVCLLCLVRLLCVLRLLLLLLVLLILLRCMRLRHLLLLLHDGRLGLLAGHGSVGAANKVFHRLLGRLWGLLGLLCGLHWLCLLLDAQRCGNVRLDQCVAGHGRACVHICAVRRPILQQPGNGGSRVCHSVVGGRRRGRGV